MRKFIPFLLAALGGLDACEMREDSLPFFLTHVEEMRKLPREDLLRMKEDILAKAAQLPDRKVNDEIPVGNVVCRGGLDASPNRTFPVEGEAVLYELGDGSHLLRLDRFRVANAPDLHVVVLSNGEQEATVRELRGNAGSQNFPIPAGECGTVQIRSLLFDATFAEADLRESADASGG